MSADKMRDAEEKIAPVQGYSAGIPWSLHLEAYDAYCERYSPQPALIEGWCRGGFGIGELDMFIPGWRDRASEIGRLKSATATQAAEIARLNIDLAECQQSSRQAWGICNAVAAALDDDLDCDIGSAESIDAIRTRSTAQAREIARLTQELAEATDQLEIERMRLAGCGVASLSNTAGTVAQRIPRDNPYWSASYGNVCSAVDREMVLRAQLAEPVLMARCPEQGEWQDVTQVEFDHASANGFEVTPLYAAPPPIAQPAPSIPDGMRKHVQDFATRAGWDKDDGEGAFEYVQRLSYKQGWDDAFDPERGAAGIFPDERASFEAWGNEFFNYGFHPESFLITEYEHEETQMAWEGWQARAMLAAAPKQNDGGDHVEG